MSFGSTRYRKAYEYDRARGIARLVPAEPVTNHIKALLARGATKRAITDAAGIGQGTITNLLNGQSSIQRPTANAILAVTLEATFARPQPTDRINSVGTRRRLQALATIGWTCEAIGARTGVNPGYLRLLITEVKGLCTRRTHEAIAKVYAELSMTPGPSAHARTRATKHRWASPLAWDDNIDDASALPNTDGASRPSTEIDHAAVQRRMAGDRTVPLTQAEAREVILGLRTLGHTYEQISELTALKPDRYVRPSRRAQTERAAA